MFEIRPIKFNEIDQLYNCELRIWPNNLQASYNQLKKRVVIHPEGIIGIWHNNKLIGTASCQRINYSKNDPINNLFKILPKQGEDEYLHLENGNCLFLMAGGIQADYRENGLWNILINYRLALAKYYNVNYALVDLRIPYYSRNNFNSDIIKYIYSKSNEKYIDPYIACFKKFGFDIIGTTTSSYIDNESGNTWVFMLKEI